MSRHLVAAALAFGVLTTASPAYALTVGYVDTARVLLTYTGARSAQQTMQKELIEYQKEFTERQKKIAEAQKAGKTPAEIQKMTEAYEKELAPLKQKAAQLEMRLSSDVKTRIEAKISAIAKARKVDLVLDKAACLFGGVDLTADVIKALK